MRTHTQGTDRYHPTGSARNEATSRSACSATGDRDQASEAGQAAAGAAPMIAREYQRDEVRRLGPESSASVRGLAP